MNETRDFFNQLAPNWEAMTTLKPEKIKYILDLAGLKEGDKVLEVGCGSGLITPFLLDYSPSSILAIDVSDEMIKEAKKREISQDDRVNFEVGDFYNLNESDFDYIFCYQVYPHLQDKEGFRETLKRILSRNGRFIIAHPDNKETINSRHSGRSQAVSKKLKAAEIEKKLFEHDFDIDTVIDSEEFYIISGKRKN